MNKDFEGWQMSFTKFNGQYEDNTIICNTYEEAYYLTENNHITLTGSSRYSNYDSFRMFRNKKLNKTKKK